jgi:hypothetical protein
MREDNFGDEDEMDNNQHISSNNMNGYNENDDIDDEEEDFFNERGQNLPNVCRFLFFFSKHSFQKIYILLNRIII